MATATDPDGDNVTLTITGSDSSAFSFDPANGALTFVIPPNFEAPADANGDNVYNVRFTASDGSASSSLNVAITVADQNDLPVITSPASASVAEGNIVVEGFEFIASDEDGDSVNFFISGGPDSSAVFASSNTPQLLRIRNAPDFESPADANGDGIYEFTVIAQDQAGGQASQSFRLTVTDEPLREIVPISKSSGVPRISRITVGDIDGDGVNDAVVAGLTSSPVSSAGRPVIMLGSSFIGVENDKAVFGFLNVGQNSGVAEVIGDVDGDGNDDVLFAKGELAEVLQGARIVSGAALVEAANDNSGPVLDTPFIVSPSKILPIEFQSVLGVNGRDNAGESVGALPDLDNDGIAEALIGAPLLSENTAFDGAAHVIFSTEYLSDSDGVLDLADSGNAFGARILGSGTFDATGRQVAAIGDVDSDGNADVAIFSRNADPFTNSSTGGRVTIIFGDAVAALRVGTLGINLIGGQGVGFAGEDPHDFLAPVVSAAGDVDNDGFDDVLLGLPDTNGVPVDPGEALLIFGSAISSNAGSQLKTTSLLPTQAVRIIGAENQDRLGAAFAAGGDLDGDGFPEIVIGAPENLRQVPSNPSQSLSGNGSIYFVRGSALRANVSGIINLSSFDANNGVVMRGVGATEGLGDAIVNLGDINGDGLSDFIVTSDPGSFQDSSREQFVSGYFISGSVVADAMQAGISEVVLPIPDPL